MPPAVLNTQMQPANMLIANHPDAASPRVFRTVRLCHQKVNQIWRQQCGPAWSKSQHRERPLQWVGYSGWQRRNEYLLESGETSLRQVVEEIERGREIGQLIICLRIVRCYPELNVNVKSHGF